MAYSEMSTGDAELDKLLTAHSNAVFDCGDYRDPGEDLLYDEDGQYKAYESAFQKAETTRRQLYEALQAFVDFDKTVADARARRDAHFSKRISMISVISVSEAGNHPGTKPG